MADSYKSRIRDLVMAPEVMMCLPEPVQLASGQWSRYFIDGKVAVVDPANFQLVGEAMVAAARAAGVDAFDAVGGLVLGAVPFAFAVAQVARCGWFLVRKEPKGRGTNRWIEGARISRGSQVALVEDVVTTGGSIIQAYETVGGEGGHVVFASALVDRGDEAAEFFARVGVPYRPLLSYSDLGIPKVGQEAET